MMTYPRRISCALCATILISSATVAWAENYAVLFSGGSPSRDPDENHERYLDETRQQYWLLVNKLDYKPQNVVILFSDGTDPGIDCDPPLGFNFNSNWNSEVANGTRVIEASSTNLQTELGALTGLDRDDMFLFWSYDHGADSSGSDPNCHDEEYLCGWGSSIADETFAAWCGAIPAGRQAYVMAQCYSGGMLEEIPIYLPGYFGCASSAHNEVSNSSGGWQGWSEEWNQGIDEESITKTWDLFEYTLDEVYIPDEQHPWGDGENLDMAVARWQGSGAGGTATNWNTSQWTWNTTDRTTVIDFTSAGHITVDDIRRAGWLFVDSHYTGSDAYLHISEIFETTGGFVVGQDRSGRVYQTRGIVEAGTHLTLAKHSGSTGRYYLSGGMLKAPEIVVGDAGMGIFEQTAGAMSVKTGPAAYGPIYVGKSAGGAGTFTLNGAAATVLAGDLHVGYKGNAVFWHQAGEVDVTGILSIGSLDGSDGTYAQSGGTLDADYLLVGREGEGLFAMTGGTAEVEHNVYVGRDPGSDGEMQIGPGADLSALSMGVGSDGHGVMDHYGGTVSLTSGLSVGDWSGGWSSYDLSAGELYAPIVTLGGEGRGSFKQTGGLVTIATSMTLGVESGCHGSYTISSNGELRVDGGTITVGVNGQGTFNLDGGTVVANTFNLGSDGSLKTSGTDAVLRINDSTGLGSNAAVGGTLEIGYGSGSTTGLVLEDDSSLNVSNCLKVGYTGEGTMTMGVDSTVTVARDLYVGDGAASDGTSTMAAGSSLTTRDSYIGFLGTGEFDHYAGMHRATRAIYVGYAGGADGEYFLHDGTARAPDLIVGSDAVGLFEQVGGATVVSGTLTVGKYADGDGHFYIDAGTLDADRVVVGDAGRGRLTHYDAETDISTELIVGAQGTGDGTVTLHDGQIDATAVKIGAGGTGTFNFNGGTLQSDQVDIGQSSTGVMVWTGGILQADDVTIHPQGRIDADGSVTIIRTVTVSGGALDATGQTLSIGRTGGTARVDMEFGTTKAATLRVGHLAGQAGFFEQTGGTCILGTLKIAGAAGAIGTYEINVGTLDVRSGSIRIGETGGVGTLIVNGGTTLANELLIGPNGAIGGSPGGVLRINRLQGSLDDVALQANLQFGHAAGWGEGRHTMSAGQTLLVGGDLTVGQEADANAWQAAGTTLQVEGDLDIAAGASTSGAHYLDGTGARLDVEGGLYVGGTSASAGGEGALTVDYAGKAAIGGLLKIWGNGTVNLKSGELIADQIVKAAGATFNFTGGKLCTRSFPGNLTNPAGTLAPGLSPGIMTVSGDYTQGAAATLEIELGGTARGSQYDALDVSGTMTLDGELEVVLIDGFTPSAGDTFNILDWGSLNGAFDIPLNLPALSNLDWDTSALYTTGELGLFSTGPGDREWTGEAGPGSPGGIFANVGNWTPTKVPGAGDRAKFMLDNTYTVQLSADAVSDRMQAQTGTVTLKGTGSPDRTYTLNSEATGTGLTVVDGHLKIEDLHMDVAGQVTVGASPYAAKLTIDDGAQLSCDRLRLGAGSGPAAFELFSGGLLVADEIVKAGKTFTTHSGSEVRANTLTGTFGAFNGDLRLGHSGGSSVSFIGASETVTVQEDLSVGYDSMATLTALGGDVTVGQRLRIGHQAGSDGTLAVNGASSDLNVTMISYVGSSGAGRLQLIGGGSATFTQGVQVGALASAYGLISVSGTDSALAVDTNAQVGFAGDGHLEVGAGGSAHVMGWTHVAGQGGSTGDISVGGSGATLALDGDVYIGGSNTAAGGTGALTVNNGGSATVGGTLKVWNSGTVNLAGGLLTAPTIQVNSGGTFIAAAGRLRTTTFTGNLVNAGAVVGPGSSPGTTTVNGNYTQGSSGILEIELGGLTRSSQYDVLDVNGLATLGGELEVLLINGFSPAGGNTFDVIDWNSRSGEFDDLDLPSLASGLLWDTSALYTAGTLAVTVGEVDDYTWDGDGGVPPTGDFFVAANWDPELPPGPPGATHQAKFTILNQSYTVRFDDTFINERARVSGSAGETITFDGTSLSRPKYKLTFVDSVTPGLDITGGHLTITDMDVEAAGDVRVGATPTAARLTIGSGGKLTCRELKIKFGGGTGAVEVLSGGTIVVDSMRKLSSGTFTSAAGSHVYTNHLYTWPEFNGDVNFGHRDGHSPTAADYTLSSSWTLDIGDDFTVGYSAPAIFTQQGDVNVGGDVHLGYANGGDGTYNLEGGTLTVGAWVRIETGKFTQSGGVLNGGIHNQGTYRYSGGTLNGDLFNAGVLELLTNMTVHGRLGIASDTIIGDNRTVNVDESLEVGMAILTIAGTSGVVNADSAVVGIIDDATIRVHDGDLHINGLLTLGDDGVGRVEVQGGSANLTADNIQVGAAAAGEFVQAGWVDVGDTLTVGSGSAPGTGLYELSNGVLTAETIVVETNGTFNFTGGKLRADTFQGSLVNAGGTLAPGSSPGLMTVSGNYTQESNSTLEIELHGLSRGSQYDALVVSGTMTLTGELEVILGFSPSEGDSFDILDWGSLAGGGFDIVDLPELDGGKAWDTSAMYSNGTISVSVAQTYDGDTDRDGDVDADDLAYFESVFGVVGDRHADFNENGRVDLGDFALMRANFGVGAASSPSVGPETETPEPIALVFLIAGIPVVLRRRRNRR